MTKKINDTLYYCEEFPDGINPADYAKRGGTESKSFRQIYILCRRRTIKGRCHFIFDTHNHSAKTKRLGALPYTTEELLSFIKNQANFESMFDTWIASGYSKDLTPLVHRLVKSEPFSLHNLVLTTLKQSKAEKEIKKQNSKKDKSISAITIDTGEVIGEFDSVSIALAWIEKEQGRKVSRQLLHSVLDKPNSTACGFKWKRSGHA